MSINDYLRFNRGQCSAMGGTTTFIGLAPFPQPLWDVILNTSGQPRRSTPSEVAMILALCESVGRARVGSGREGSDPGELARGTGVIEAKVLASGFLLRLLVCLVWIFVSSLAVLLDIAFMATALHYIATVLSLNSSF
ncbi:unnamed protein product [Protopolystoma xenopodis]|uniref:Uncharacterized protein n=1 Tax=Protopolystoma xenopodis TaxID=117903 RepID=A0A3S5A395_9PLAT|nr:unnamed protein product [Protopolystoma xenopodis]